MQKLEKALEQDPDLPAAHSTIALLYDSMGDATQAERHYRRAVRLDPEDPDALNALGIFLCKATGTRTEAIGVFDRALADPLYQRRQMLFVNAGVCARQANRDLAEGYFRNALSLDPGYGEALLQMADLSHERGVGLQARAFLERFFATGQASPVALGLAIRVERAMGDEGAARRYEQRLLSTFPESVEARRIIEGGAGG